MRVSSRQCLVAILAALCATAVQAEMRPTVRPNTADVQSVDLNEVLADVTRLVIRDSGKAPRVSKRPMRRPARKNVTAPPVKPAEESVADLALLLAPEAIRAEKRPQLRPVAARKGAKPTTSEPPVSIAICGRPSIQGQMLPPVEGRIEGCGIDNPVRVTSVSGVALDQDPVINCQTARALDTWVAKGLQPAAQSAGESVKSIGIAAHYACRTRNHKAGARLSEHSKGNAVDIASIKLESGDVITLLQGWKGSMRDQGILRAAHKAACGPFGTVLGPDADVYHEDHFHFDTASYRGGAYCR